LSGFLKSISWSRPVAPRTTLTRVDCYQTIARVGLCWPLKLPINPALFPCAVAGPVTWAIMAWAIPLHPISLAEIWSLGFVSAVIWSPLWEELLFRGLLQGELIERGLIQPWVYGLSSANIFVSLLFAACHLWNHSVTWTILIIFPSLAFGFLRDRFGSTIPSILLHMWYNCGYFLLFGFA